MQHRRHYGREQLEKMTNELQDTFSLVKENVAIRKLKLQDAVDMHMVFIHFTNSLIFNS